jgi:integrase
MAKPRRPKFTGSVYPRGPIWQLQYFVDGQRFRESSKSTSKEEAQKLLNTRLSEARAGQRKVKDTTMAALGKLYLEARAAYWKPKTAEWAKGIWTNHIEPVFGTRAPASILPGDIDAYVSKLKMAGVSDCYINRHLVILKAMLRYGVRSRVLREVPEFPDKFDERPFVHTGHLDSWDFITFCDQIPDNEPWLEAMVTAAFIFGFRKAELLYMRVSQIDFARHVITLPAGTTKNRMPRKVVLNAKSKLTKLLVAACKDKAPNAYVFSRDAKGSIPVRDFRVSFDRAATAAKITTGSGPNGKLHFHDLRRSAITRMDSAGLSETESMAIAGHLSADVHRRYKQLSEQTAREIASRIDIE